MSGVSQSVVEGAEVEFSPDIIVGRDNPHCLDCQDLQGDKGGSGFHLVGNGARKGIDDECIPGLAVCYRNYTWEG
ncbi:hypothetical protein S40285_10733, partial [Stachybotrys chlorohalonatus IBT 40285]